ncbi:MAG: hypothetical protein ABJB05_08330 [Parafilimonas sp.]
MTVNYKIWFSLNIMHEFFNSNSFTDCSLEPSADTIQTFFNGTTWLRRSIDSNLLVLLKADDAGLPAVQVAADKFFRFYLTCNNPLFFNYSNIDARIGKGYILYLSNLAANKVDPLLNLSVPVPAFSSYPAGNIFFPGDLVTDAADNVCECILQSTNNLPNDATHWFVRTTKQYVSSADVLRVSPANYQTAFTDGISSLNTTIKGFKVAGNAVVEYNVFTITQVFPNAVNNVQVDLSSLQPGRYKISLSATKASDSSVINQNEIIYYDGAIGFKKAIGIVEIFNCLSTTDNYALQQNGSNIINETAYTISFANRIAWWNYIARTNTVTGINSTVSGLQFNQDALNNLLFVSNIPVQFVQQFIYTPFTVLGPSPPPLIPWPSPNILKSEKDINGVTTKVFTETYLNY